MKYLAFALLLVGCGAEVSDLYGNDYADGGNGAGASSSSPTNGGGPNNSSSSNAGGAPSSNNSNSSNSNSNSSNSNSSTSTMGGAGTTDVSTSNSTTGDPTSNSTTGPGEDVFVQCNDVPCNVSAGNVCCLGTIGDSCVAENDCFFTDTPVKCDDPFDCGGNDVCCGFVDGGQNYEEIRCASDCVWPDRTLCDPSGPDCEPIFSGGMNQEAVCAQSSLLPDGYLVCKLP